MTAKFWGNLQEKRPWELLREEATVADAGTVINVCLGIALLLAGLVEPFIPNISSKVSPRLSCNLRSLAGTWQSEMAAHLGGLLQRCCASESAVSFSRVGSIVLRDGPCGMIGVQI